MLGGVRMGQQSQALLLMLVMLISEACEPIRYGLDDPQQCKNIRVKWLKDDQCAIIVGKITPPQSPRSVRSCQMILGASSTSKYQFVQLTFDTFYINSCAVVLQITDSPSAQFDSKVRELALLSCESPNPGKIYSHEGNHVKLFLKREDKYIRNYNFRINASLSAGPPVHQTSIKTILIIIALVVAVLLVGFGLCYKYYLMRQSRWLETSANMDTGEPCTPRVRHRFPGINHPRSTVGTQTLMNVDLHNRHIHSSPQNNNIPVDNEPHVHIIYGGQNGTVVLDTATDSNIDLDCSPPSYEEAISMPTCRTAAGLALLGGTTDNAASAARTTTTTTAEATPTAALETSTTTPTEVKGAVGGVMDC